MIIGSLLVGTRLAVEGPEDPELGAGERKQRLLSLASRFYVAQQVLPSAGRLISEEQLVMTGEHVGAAGVKTAMTSGTPVV